jgi:hypothetical protein
MRLPGVFLHELAHLLAGVLLGAEPHGFSLIPGRNRRGSGWILGSVTFGRITAFNAVPVALAPLGLLPLAYGVWRCWFGWFPATLPGTMYLYAVLFVIVTNALPSRQDLRVACRWRSLLLYGVIAAACGYLAWRGR